MSLGQMSIRVPTTDGSYIPLTVDVINIDVPFLIGLDVLDTEKLVADNVDNKLTSRCYGWSIPITRRNKHMYITALNHHSIHTVRAKKMHQHFWHTSASKLYNLLKRMKPEATNEKTLTVFKEIQATCHTCQKYGKGPHRFRVSLPSGECTFNHEIAMDLLWIEGHPALHVVDMHTNFSAAVFLQEKSTASIWNAFILCWATAYIGYPDKMRLDQDSVFTSEQFRTLAVSAGIELQYSGVESHNALGAGERYHAPLRRIYNINPSNLQQNQRRYSNYSTIHRPPTLYQIYE